MEGEETCIFIAIFDLLCVSGRLFVAIHVIGLTAMHPTPKDVYVYQSHPNSKTGKRNLNHAG